MERVLVSSCLLGEPVRYDGGHRRSASGVLQRWLREGRVVPVCPEVAGGLPVPRPAAELAPGATGLAVAGGSGKVITATGADVTAPFVQGANMAVDLALALGIRLAVLKEGSPSCGTGATHDGTFSGVKVPNLGVTAALLRQAGLEIFSEGQFELADSCLAKLEAGQGLGFLRRNREG